MKRLKYLCFFIFTCLIIGCSDPDDIPAFSQSSVVLNCDNLVTALLDLNKDSLESILNRELENFDLLDLDNDACLHDRNLKAFKDFLNDNCDEIKAEVLCCGCIETLPLISEISVELDSVGVEVTRILDLWTPGKNGIPLSFSDVHL